MLIFYGKVNCLTNLKQLKWLESKDIDLTFVDILNHSWSVSQLQKFFSNKPIRSCVNTNAPEIKRGNLNVHDFSETDLLEKMVMCPILIRRPLIEVGHLRLVGFDQDTIDLLTKALNIEDTMMLLDDMTSCTHKEDWEA